MISLMPRSNAICLLSRPRDFPQYLALAGRQRREPLDARSTDLAGPLRGVPLDARGDRVEQGLVAHRLGQEIDRAGLHRLNSHRDVAMPGQKDDRLGVAARRQTMLQIETARARHAHVEDQAARAVQ